MTYSLSTVNNDHSFSMFDIFKMLKISACSFDSLRIEKHLNARIRRVKTSTFIYYDKYVYTVT